MDNLLSKLKANKFPVIAAFIHWFLLMILQVDRNLFLYEHENREMLIGKIAAFFLLEFIWIVAFKLYRGWKEDQFSKRFVHIWSFYTLILCLLLLVLWPGTWSWDDLLVLATTQYYHLVPWQHVLSSYEQIILLQLFPLPGGYVLVKNLLIAGIVAYSICKIEQTCSMHQIFKNHYWFDILVKLIPFLLPPVLMYQFSGYRLGLYIYLELLMFVIMICSLKNNYKWTKFRISMFALLITVCASWRSESLFYALLGIIFLAVGKNITLSKKKRALGVVLILIFFGSLTSFQNHALKNSNYEIISTLRPAVELIRHSDIEKDADELMTINQVVDVEKVKAHPDHNGEKAYWGDKVVRKNYTKKEYKEYLKAITHLSVRYPSVAWRERWDSFAATSGFWGDRQYKNIDTSIDMLIPGKDQYDNAFSKIVTVQKYPVFSRFRAKFIHFMGMKRHGKLIQPLHAIEWNIIVPMLALLIAFVKVLYQKKWMYAVILAFVLVKIPVVFLTAPSTWFMYYLSFYFLGYVLLDFYLVYRIGERRRISDNER